LITHYQILCVSERASTDEIKKAYKKLALIYHPDKNLGNPESEEKFKEINLAYQTLIDPNKRSRYDFKLYYQRSQSAPENSTPKSGVPQTKRQRSVQIKRKFIYNKRWNKIGNRWALGIFALTVLGVLVQVNLKKYLEERELERLQTLKADFMAKASIYYQHEVYDSTFYFIDSLRKELPIDQDVYELRKSVINQISQKAEGYFDHDDCAKALPYFAVLKRCVPDASSMTIYKMALCQKFSGDIDGSLATMIGILEQEPESIIVHNEIALLYQDYKADYTNALKYYEIAAELIVKEYEGFYGKAYPLVVNPEKTAEVHYDTHYGLAICFTKFKRYREALNACSWAIFLRPNYAKTYEIEGLDYYEQGETKNACQSWNKALSLNSEVAQGLLDRYCR